MRTSRSREEHPERFAVIDADRSPDDVFGSVREALDKLLHEHEHEGASGS